MTILTLSFLRIYMAFSHRDYLNMLFGARIDVCKRYIRYFSCFFAFFSIVLNSIASIAEENRKTFVVSHAEPLDASHPRMSYELDVLKLALESTRESHGDFKINIYPYSSRARIKRELKVGRYENALHVFGYAKNKTELRDFTYVRFPVFLGVLGYRVCFVSEQVSAAFARIKSAAELKQFVHGQGAGWTDAFVFKENGLDVVEFDHIPRLIRMTASNRIHTFCRGISEIKDEYEDNRELSGLVVDPSVALYYQHPRFYFTHKDNVALKERVELGLRNAFVDGSLLALFLRVHKENLDYVNVTSRRIIELENPALEDLDFDFSPYLYDPDFAK